VRSWGGVLGERWHSKLTRRAVSGKYSSDPGDRPTTGERASTAPPRNPEERNPAGQDHPERDRAGGGASRVD
jgi:hypothetical protein